MSNSFCTVCQTRRRRNMLSMQTADHDVHDDAGRMLLVAVSINHDDRHRNVASDVFDVIKLPSTRMLLGIATI